MNFSVSTAIASGLHITLFSLAFLWSWWHPRAMNLFPGDGIELAFGDSFLSGTTQKSVSTPVKKTPIVSDLNEVDEAEEDTTQDAAPQQNIINSAQTTTGQRGQGSGGVMTVKEKYIAQLLQKIEAYKRYPNSSRMREESGVVKLSFSILKDGSITDVKIQERSPFAALDKAALQTLESVKKTEPIPETLQKDRLDLVLPIEFGLLDGTN